MAYAQVTIESNTELGTLKSDDSGSSEVTTLSDDGSIAGGLADNSSPYSHAAIWSGTDWKTKTDPGTLNRTSGESRVNVLSDNGKIAGGRAVYRRNDSNYHAVIWRFSGGTWQQAIDLGTLTSGNTGRSDVNSLSNDGTVAGGSATMNSSGTNHAAIWRSSDNGATWSKAQDLGALISSRFSEANTLSGDGQIVGGWATSKVFARGEEHHAVIWLFSGAHGPSL